MRVMLTWFSGSGMLMASKSFESGTPHFYETVEAWLQGDDRGRVEIQRLIDPPSVICGGTGEVGSEGLGYDECPDCLG